MSGGFASSAIFRDPAQTLLAAQGLIGAALIFTRYGHLDPFALVLVTAAAVLTLIGVWHERAAGAAGAEVDPSRAGGGEREPSRLAQARRLLTGILVVYLVYGFVFELASDRRPAHLAFVAVSALLLIAEWRCRRGRRARVVAAIAAFLISGVLQIRGEDAMDIDVWVFQQEAAAALQRGENPYGIGYTNVTGRVDWYPPGMADLGRVSIFPYPPETVIANAVPYALGKDVRYATLVATAIAAAALARLGPVGIELHAVLALLVEPVTMHTIRKAWTEPILLAAMLLLLLAIRAARAAAPKRWVAVGVTAGVVAGAKQYAPLLLLPLLAAVPRSVRGRSVLLAIALALVMVVPFAWWDPQGLWRSVVLFHARQVFRADALSWPAAAFALGLGRIPWYVGVAAMFSVLVATWPRKGSLTAAAGCGPAAFLAGLLLTNAFGNYYWAMAGIVLATALLALGDRAAVHVS